MILALLMLALGADSRPCYPPNPEPTHDRFVPITVNGREVYVLDLHTRAIVKSFQARDCIEDVQIAPDGHRVACIDKQGVLSVLSWTGDAEDRSLAASPVMKVGDRDWADYALAWSPQGNSIAVLHSSVGVKIVDVDNWAIRRVEFDGIPTRVNWSREGTRLAIGMEPRAVKIVEASATGNDLNFQLTAMRPHPVLDGVTALEFGPGGRVLAVGCWGAIVEVWNLDRVCPLSVLEAGRHWAPQAFFEISDLAFSPDGSRLVATTVDLRMLTEWEWAGGRRLVHLQAEGGNWFPLRTLYSADGSRIRCNWLGLSLCSGTQPARDPFLDGRDGWMHPVPEIGLGIRRTMLGADVFDFDSSVKLYSVSNGVIVR